MMYKLYFSQKLPISLDEAWDFFSSPDNLEKITPCNLDFKIQHHWADKNMYSGQIIAYTIRPFWNIKLEWVTEIIAIQKPEYFIDEQKFGPYIFWHHEHWFSAISKGVVMEDLIYYKLPWGILGKALHHMKIKKDLDAIFIHRRAALEKIFGPYLEN